MAKMLREIADAIEAGKVERWELLTEVKMVDVSSIGERHYVDGGLRDITFRATVAV